MQDLFEEKANKERTKNAPLAERLRPRQLSDFIGQRKIMGRGKTLESLIRSGRPQSLIFWGPPGTGKTTLALLIAQHTQAHFVHFSAVTSGVKEVRQTINQAQDRLKFESKQTILFVDEIHRFNKTQQDGFLPFVEDGTIILIGATTENPGFALTAPLQSRSRIFIFEALEENEILRILKRATEKFPQHKFKKTALKFIAHEAEGDARAALNILELTLNLTKNLVTSDVVKKAVQKKGIYFDKKGDYHYDTISAFIKSMRGGSADGALYWLARMIEAGEDPRFIARRMVIFASEDVGNADPHALTLANSCFQAVANIGYPEARIILGQVVVYLSEAPKSNASYLAIEKALETVRTKRIGEVPKHLRNAPTKLAKSMGYGADYQYPHNYEGAVVEQSFLPENLASEKFYQPKNVGFEKKIIEREREREKTISERIDNDKCPKGLDGK
ncbi:MAG: putative ATPase [Candidatus Berkelbacteria bacterium Licking1014_7]|uniref:Putative ATPase n=1 Tax=Candidatus Berkelbacteria bacterium Licking1014_7 TaxID=2017147 RepID=A0A554LIF6_9BACT|nr:MAG: putative ATPase [Candidatus Berkelbacteria bacterium Licking1014_7]